MSSGHPAVLVVAAKWWPLSARMAAALVRLNCSVSTLCPPHHPLTFVEGVRHEYSLSGIRTLASLERAIKHARPDFIIPCDDGVVALLHGLHAASSALRPVIERSLGPADSFDTTKSRFELLLKAEEWGLRVPITRRVSSVDDLKQWHEHVGPTGVLKVDGESGGNGVRIARSFDEAVAAWEAFRRPSSSIAALKRLVIDRDPLILWSRRQTAIRDVTIQQYIPGRPANAMLACWQGKLLGAVFVTVVSTEGPTGASTIVRVIQHEEMKQAAQCVASKLHLTGFYGLDFVLDTSKSEGINGPAYLIEMNPRCTQLGHIELPGQGSLAAIYNAAMRGEGRPAVINPINKSTIALFPQALMAGEPCRPFIDASYHDKPTGDPKLLKELLQKSWPQRQWLARAYHAFQPMNRLEPVVYEAAELLNADRAAAPVQEPRRQRSSLHGVAKAVG